MIDGETSHRSIPSPSRTVGDVLVTGSSGKLGHDLVAIAERSGVTVHALDSRELDISDLEACRAAVAGHTVVLNAAAYTDVDTAEEEPERALAVNATGPENLAWACAEFGAVLVQYSTDYVFDGTRSTPYAEDAELNPINAYGRSKAEGERRAMAANPDGTIILRTAWLYGEHGSSFVSTMIRLYREHGTLTVVDDQHGQPTWSRDLADQTFRLLETSTRQGVFHATNSGSTTWHGFAQAIVENLGGDPASVVPTGSAHFPRPARRPVRTVLGHDAWARVGLAPMRPWRAALDDAMSQGVFA